MNKSAESSFAPLEYYKKLTNCLANRKNLKLNISKIQGVRSSTDFRFKSTPFITNRKIQLKFLANYRMRKEFNANQKQQREKLANKPNEAIFNVKKSNNTALNEKLKRKTTEESYINLSDSYFKGNQVPDLSLFKVPGIPPIKRQKIQILPNTVNTSSITLASLFSGNFNPPQFSTPITEEKAHPKPLIADPNDILRSLENLESIMEEESRDKGMNDRIKAARELDKMKAYKNLIDDAATYVESVCFGELTDAIIAIIKRLYKKYEEASQSPRPSLVSSTSVRSLINVFSQTSMSAKKTQSWPVPIFYNQTKGETVNDFTYDNNDDDINPLFENTNDLFSFLDEDDPLDLGITPIEFDKTPTTTSQTSFFSHAPHPSANTFLASTRFCLTPYPRSPRYGDCDDLDWLETKFSTSMDMSWETGTNFTFATNRNDNLNSDISAIFRSPPKSNNLESKKPFSRVISRPKTTSNRNSESDGLSDKEDDFSWWFNDNDDTPNNNSFMQNNDTQDFF
jgi:hypothetical protein